MLNLIVEKIREYFNRSKHPILLSYLFGSQATGLSSSESDYDIAILLKDTDPNQQMRIYRRILFETAKIIGEKDLDLLLLNGDETKLACKAVCFGKLLYSVDEKFRVGYQTRMLCRYFELKDFRRIHQSILSQNFEIKTSV